MSVNQQPPSKREPLWVVDGATLERARLLRAWTYGDVADAAKVDRGTVSALMQGRRRPRLATLQCVCIALDVALHRVVRFRERGSSEDDDAS